jgi:hypothetical protein
MSDNVARDGCGQKIHYAVNLFLEWYCGEPTDLSA